MQTYYIELWDNNRLVKTEKIKTKNYDDVSAKVASYMNTKYQIHCYDEASYLVHLQEECYG